MIRERERTAVSGWVMAPALLVAVAGSITGLIMTITRMGNAGRFDVAFVFWILGIVLCVILL